MNDFSPVTAFSLLPEKEQERLADQAARELLSHPMRSKAFFKRCTFQFLSELKQVVDEQYEARQALELESEQQQLMQEISAMADKMGISMEEALAGIELK